MEKKRGSNVLRVIPFARTTREASATESAAGWQLQRTAGEAGRGTNLEVAVGEAVAELPSGMLHRVVLISDGKENLGTVARATWQAQEMGIPIDTVAMAGRPKPNLRAESVSFPSQVFQRRAFPNRPYCGGAEEDGGQRGDYGRGQEAGREQHGIGSGRESRPRAHQHHGCGRGGYCRHRQRAGPG